MDNGTGHVLVVDDNRMNRIKLSHGLERQGHTVGLAENGLRALEMLRAESFDLVLLDILMPEMDGIEALEVITGDAGLRDIPVIMVSALDEMDSVVRCIELGAVDYLPKPVDPVLLQARVRSSLGKKKLRDLEQAYLQQEITLRQTEKLANLGKLSAGMAHELNNPAAAAQRGVTQLRQTLDRLLGAQRALSRMRLTDEQWDTLLAREAQCRRRAMGNDGLVTDSDDLDALARSDREDAMDEWLEAHGITNGWEVAPTLVDLGYTPEQLREIAATFPDDLLPPVVEWLCGTHVVQTVLDEIGDGAARISAVVQAMKSYSYMDQAPAQAVDVHQGLDDTLVVLRNKLGDCVTVRRDYAPDLPMSDGYGSEINQVWTNVLDNAADATSAGGTIVIRTRHEGGWVIVEIEDDGPGISPEVQSCIFDPFFTTKPPGQGVGLGLNISHNIVVQKHGGLMSVESEPGRTTFEVRLPVASESG